MMMTIYVIEEQLMMVLMIDMIEVFKRVMSMMMVAVDQSLCSRNDKDYCD